LFHQPRCSAKALEPETIKGGTTKSDRSGFNMTEPRFFVAVQHGKYQDQRSPASSIERGDETGMNL
jgi:hypothetical protein